MEVRAAKTKDVNVVTVEGDVDATNSVQLTSLFDGLLGDNGVKFVLDFDAVGFMDSSGLSAVITFLKHVRINEGDVFLANLRPPVRRVFELTRLNQVFEICDSVEEAVSLHSLV